MGLPKTTTLVDVYEHNGQEVTGLEDDRPRVVVQSHWNREEMVLLRPGQETYTVLASDLRQAISNCSGS